MLYIGEKVGLANGVNGGRARCAANRHRRRSARRHEPVRHRCAGAIAVLAASEKGGLLHAPDLYMEKLIVPGRPRNVVDLDAPVGDNLRAIAKALEPRRRRPRHHGARSPAAREADRRHPRDRRAHQADRRRRSLRGHRRRGGRDRRARGHGHRRRAGRRPDGRRDALPERRDLRAARRRTPEDEARCQAMGITDLRRIYTAQRSRARRVISSSPRPASPMAR